MTLPAFTEEMLAQFNSRGLHCRVLGGVGIALRCLSARTGALARSYSDLDVLTTSRHAADVAEVLEKSGFEPHDEFNRLNGHARMLFDTSAGAHVDVFVGAFQMCHRLDVGNRLLIEDQTLTLADLFLTKAQIAQMTAKDVTDIVALVNDHDLTADDRGINAPYVASFLASDWGWWRTVTDNMGRIGDLAEELELDASLIATARERLRALRAAIDARPKSLKWSSRARIGDRIRWREDPEGAE